MDDHPATRNHCEHGHYEEDNPIWPRCMDEHADELEGALEGRHLRHPPFTEYEHVICPVCGFDTSYP